MITKVIILVGADIFQTLEVGKDGVNKLFFDKLNPNVLVALCEDEICTYQGYNFIAHKAYKEE